MRMNLFSNMLMYASAIFLIAFSVIKFYEPHDHFGNFACFVYILLICKWAINDAAEYRWDKFQTEFEQGE